MRLRSEVGRLRFGSPVTHVYNPLEYAWAPHRQYLRLLEGRPGRILLLGMNPGPFGMAQTGVPFGDVAMVRDWMGIEAAVGAPERQHPRRPVAGFECRRSEVSGTRLWGWARRTFGTPERFFARFLVMNYCPLCFMEASGRNVTPDKLPARQLAPLLAACDAALLRSVQRARPSAVIGVGRWAEHRAHEALDGVRVRIGWVPHPSPASPASNRDWAGLMSSALKAQGVSLP